MIQKYIERPMLVNGRKYDIRVWVLLTHELDLYFFKEGYIRTSCEEFRLDKDDLYVHLTNNAVQKHSNNYGNFEKGNQLSFDDIEAIFQQLEERTIRDPMSTTSTAPSPEKLNEDEDESPGDTPREEPTPESQCVSPP